MSRPRAALPLLAAAIALPAAGLVLPATASAAYDLTVSDTPTTNATLTQTTPGGTTQLRATGPGATVNAAELEASLRSSSNVFVAASTGGGEAGGLTVARPLSAPDATLAVSPGLGGAIRVNADLALKTLSVGGDESGTGPAVEVATSRISAREQLVLSRPLRLLSPTVLQSGTVVLTGASGTRALEVVSQTLVLRGTLGTAEAPLGSFTASGRVQLQGAVRTTGHQTLGPTSLAAASVLTSTDGDVRVTGPVGQTQNSTLGHSLSVSAAGAVRLGEVGPAPDGDVPPRSLAITASSIALEGDVRTRDAQTYTGRTDVPASRTLRGGTVHLRGPVALAGASRLTLDASTAGSVGGPLLGSAPATLDLRGAAAFVLDSPVAPDAVPVELAGPGRTVVTTPHPRTPFVLRGGVLGGAGPVGAVTSPAGGRIDPGSVGSGAFGAPTAPTDLTLAALTLTPGASVRLDGAPGPRAFDALRVAGPVDLGGAVLDLAPAAGTTVPPGATVTLVDHTGPTPTVGTFAGRPEGSTVDVDGVPLALSYAGGDGNDVTLTRARAAATLALVADVPTTVRGQEVRFVARVTPATATGSVTFRDGDRPLGSVQLDTGVAVLRTAHLTPGDHEITAEYVGDGATAPATSGAVVHTVTVPIGPGDPPPTDPGPGVPDPSAPAPDPGTAGPGGPSPGARDEDPTGTRPTAPPAAPAPPAGGPTRAAMRAALARLTRVRVGTDGLRFRQRIPASGRARWRLTVRGSSRMLASRTARVTPGDRAVTLWLSARGRRVLRRDGRARLVLRTELTLASGEHVSMAVTLPRPRT
jgi:hypothetical protein